MKLKLTTLTPLSIFLGFCLAFPAHAEPIASARLYGYCCDTTGQQWDLSLTGVEEDETGRSLFVDFTLQAQLTDYASHTLLMPAAFGQPEEGVVYATELTGLDGDPGLTETGSTCIQEVRIPSSIRSIHANYFSQLSHLTNVCFQGDAPEILEGTELALPANCVLSVARGSAGWGTVPGIWNGFETRHANAAAPTITRVTEDGDPSAAHITIACENLQSGDYFCWEVSFDDGKSAYGTDATTRTFTVTNACTIRAYSVSEWYPQSDVATLRVGSEKTTPWTVKFDANGGFCSTALMEVGANGTLETLPTPSRSGCTFSGWSTAMDGGSLVTTATTITTNLTLYAQWEDVESSTVATVELTLKPGLTWFSLGHVVPTNGSPDVLFKDCAFSENDIIKTATESATYHDGAWYPKNFTVKSGKGYLAQLHGSEPITATITGTLDDSEVALDAGWNWIGPRLSDEVEIASLLNASGFAEGDQILTQAGDSNYGEFGWEDPTIKVEPLIGYRVNVSSEGSVSTAGGDAKVQVLTLSTLSPVMQSSSSLKTKMNRLASAQETWAPVAQPNTFILYATVPDAHDGDRLGVFTAAGECRGVAAYDADAQIFQLSVGVTTTNETAFTLRYRSDGEDCVVGEAVRNPGGDETCGTISEPISLSPAPSAEGATTTALLDDERTVYQLTPTDLTATNLTISWPAGSSAVVSIPSQIDVVQGVSAENVSNLIVRSGSYDITGFLTFTSQSDGAYAIALKPEIVAETLDAEKGAELTLDPAAPVITTAATRPGLTYSFYEATSLESLVSNLQGEPTDSHIGDGAAWTPTITVKGGESAFYTISVTK